MQVFHTLAPKLHKPHLEINNFPIPDAWEAKQRTLFAIDHIQRASWGS